MDLTDIAAWLKESSASQAIQARLWVLPAIHSVHILAVAILFASALFLNLRILGFVGFDEPVAAFGRRYVRWIWGGFIVLVLTGLVMVVGEPDRSVLNWLFWTKLALVLTAAVLSAALHLPLARNPYVWDAGSRRGMAVLLSGASMVLWVAIIVCGRWIAYVIA